MAAIFLKTLPFFMLIGLGWLAGRTRFFPEEATAWLTKFVFYFALSAMLFGFAATLDLDSLFDPRFALAYLSGSALLWIAGLAVARMRGETLQMAAIEAHCCIIGNTGFLGVPMLVVLLGPQAVGPVLMVLTIDLIVFSTLLTLIMAAARQGRIGISAILPILRGILANPMIVSMVAGLGWAQARLPMPEPLAEFLSILGSAATPGALFAIGASLAASRAERIAPAIRLSAAKLVLHPAAVGGMAFFVFGVDPFAAGVMMAAAALPVAGNVYMLAQYFGIGAQRVSTAILISTLFSVITVPFVIHWIGAG